MHRLGVPTDLDTAIQDIEVSLLFALQVESRLRRKHGNVDGIPVVGVTDLEAPQQNIGPLSFPGNPADLSLPAFHTSQLQRGQPDTDTNWVL